MLIQPKSALADKARQALLPWVVLALLGLGGCASGPGTNPRDPFEPFNRNVMKFNEGIDAVLLKPAATVYRKIVPPLMRTGVSNFFGNLGEPWSFVNSVLQLKFQNAAETFMRFNVNTFFGLGGILDVASDLNIERHKEDFGQTLGRWGVPPGPFIMLPLLGPSTLRDTAALTVDRKADPLLYVHPVADRDELYALRAVDIRANLLRLGSVIDGAALDKYSFTRDAYLQKRRAEIFETESGSAPSADDKGGSDSDGQIPPDPSPSPEPAPRQPASAPAR